MHNTETNCRASWQRKVPKIIAGLLLSSAVSFPFTINIGAKEPATQTYKEISTETGNYSKMYLKKRAIELYLIDNNAELDLIKLTDILIALCELYDIDPFRPMAIMILETDYGKSDAMKLKRNVCGMNWTERQKDLIGITSDIYNVAIEKTLEASVTNLVVLLDTYRSFNKPLVTLSEIQPKYAPSNDPRNGLDGMDNNAWLRNTLHHYKGMEKIYLELE